MQEKSGSAPRARFTLAEEPRNLKRLMAAANSSGRCFSPTRSKKVRRGSAPERSEERRVGKEGGSRRSAYPCTRRAEKWKRDQEREKREQREVNATHMERA